MEKVSKKVLKIILSNFWKQRQNQYTDHELMGKVYDSRGFMVPVEDTKEHMLVFWVGMSIKIIVKKYKIYNKTTNKKGMTFSKSLRSRKQKMQLVQWIFPTIGQV